MQTRDISYQAGGKSMTGYLADGSKGGKAPGVLVCHQGMGLRDHEKERARMLADLGYVAFVLDLYGEVPTARERMGELLNGCVQSPALWDEFILAGLAQLKAQPNVDLSRLAAIGFCFGGMTVIEAVRATTDLKCVVAFHPGFTMLPESDPRPVSGKVMVCAGQRDPLIPEDGRNRFLRLMAEANADLQYLNYGEAGHSFTDKSVDAMGMPGFNYHALTDRRSWAAMRGLFDETFA
ncbi:MAG: dienelactone hydrolase family protein [Hyphomonadaceae bacterium]